MATNKPQDDYQKQGVRIPRELHTQIHAAAAASGRSYNSELIARLQASFNDIKSASAKDVEPQKADWAERFHLYRIEAQIEATRTQQRLVDMQIQMLDGKLDQLALNHAGKAKMHAPERELEAARELRATLDQRLLALQRDYQAQQALADEKSREELRAINGAVDRSLQDEFKDVHALEEVLNVPRDHRYVVVKPPSSKPAKKPAAPKKS